MAGTVHLQPKGEQVSIQLTYFAGIVGQHRGIMAERVVGEKPLLSIADTISTARRPTDACSVRGTIRGGPSDLRTKISSSDIIFIIIIRAAGIF